MAHRFVFTLFIALAISQPSFAAATDEYDLFEVDEKTSVFAPNDESFVAIMSETSETLNGDVDELFSDRTSEMRQALLRMEAFTFQSESPPARSKQGPVDVVSARVLLRRENKTYVILEEHRFLGKKSYVLFTFSVLNKENAAKAAAARIAATFTADLAKTKVAPRRWWVASLFPFAHAREGARANGAGNGSARASGPSRVRDPRCMNVGIEDRNDIRFLNEPRPSLTSFANAADCGAGGKEAWDNLVASLNGPSNWLVSLGVNEREQRLARINPVAGTGIEAIKGLEGIYGLVSGVVSTVADRKLGVFSYLLQETKNDDRRTNCMTNAAQMRQVCRRLASIAPALAARRPITATVRGGARVAASSVRAPLRGARERLGVLAGRTTLERTTNQLVTGRVRIRDGGFRGSIVNTTPTAGNYTIVNTRSITRQGPRNQLTLIESSDGVGPGATLKRIKADNEDYIPGHRTSVGNVTIGPQGEVRLAPHPKSSAGDLEILNQQLRELGIRPK